MGHPQVRTRDFVIKHFSVARQLLNFKRRSKFEFLTLVYLWVTMATTD